MLNILDKLSGTSKRTEKEQILKSLNPQETSMFKRLAYLTYDPSVDYYIKEFETATDHLGCVTLESALYDLEQIIASRVFTGNMAKQWVEQQYEMLSKDDAEVFKRVIKRDLRIGMNSKSINKLFPETIYEHPYMRCSSFNEKNLKNISYPCYSQTKMDGLYCDVIVHDDKVEYRSRNGSYLQFNHEETDKLLIEHYPNTVLMGEAIAVDEHGKIMNRQKSNGYLNSNEIDPDRIVFYFWDVVSLDDFNKKQCNIPYSDRLATLDGLLIDLHDETKHKFKLVDSVLCDDEQDIIEHFRENRLFGEEGTVIKDKAGLWKPGTSKHQVKVKVIFECEMKAVGYKEGTGKNEGRLGAITFQSLDGDVEVSVGAGYKDSEREDWWDQIDEWISIGRVATIKANDVVTSESNPDKMSLFLPRFVEWRTDKSTADTKDKIIEQVKSFTDALQMIGE